MSIPYIRLASNQRDIWHDQTAHSESPLYNIGGTLVISGKVDYVALNKAIQQLINENDAFRININKHPPSQQKLLDPIAFQLELIDFSNQSSAQDKAQIWLDNAFKKPFTFNEINLLWRFALIKESDCRYYLMTKYHHVIADGWSTTVVIARIAEIYNALLNNQTIETKAAHRYFNFIEKEQEYLNSQTYQTDEKFWATILPEAPNTLIPRRYPISSDTILPKSNIYRFKIAREVYNQINTFSVANKSTSYHTFLTALASYFARIYQRKDIVIGVPSLNRSGARYKDVLGMFISLSPLVLEITPSNNAAQILQHCRARLREVYRHRRFPLGEMGKRLKLLQHGRDTLFDIILSYEKHEYSAHYGDASITAIQQFSGVARYPLAVTICEFSDTDDVEIIFEGAENCFTLKDLAFLAERIQLILQQMLEQPEKPIKTFELLSPSDKNILYHQFNQKNNPLQAELPNIIQLFQQQVKQWPLYPAIEFNDTIINYQQLDQLSSQLSIHLCNQWVNNHSIIAICLPRCTEMVVALLATLKTAASYLPLPIDIPDERIKNIMQQSNASILLTTRQFEARLSQLNQYIICVDDYPIENNTEKTPVENTITPDALAYTIFTSGSTGQPKGVMITHTALSIRMQWLQSLFKITPKDRMGQTIPYNFDPSLIEIFLALTQGASLILTPENSYTVEGFAKFIIEQEITALASVPSSIRMLLQGLKAEERTKLRVICSGGETLDPSLAKQFLQHTDAQLFNFYGPTEATIAASAWKCSTQDPEAPLSIGKPADNTHILVVDKQLNPLPINEIGEIIISGNTLAQGYINQPELTNHSFLNSPFRLYKTGDLGYISYDGTLYFSGRVDRQVKISGYRIELGEIESILQLNYHVNMAAVISQKKNIIAYVETTAEETSALTKELSLLLRQKLPSYMQPQRIIALTAIKLTPTGKIDYALLPKPNQEQHALNSSPQTALERQLHPLWQKALSSQKISIHDNFFERGGDSLSAVSLMVAIENLTGIRHPLSFLLEHPSISEQASALHQQANNNTLMTLSEHPNAITIFIAASGNGDLLRLSNLASSLGDDYNIHMLQPPEEKNISLSIHSIAQCYASIIMQFDKQPYYIAGFSIGGITAIETAKILESHNKSPQGIILLDSIYPRWPLRSPWIFKSLQYLVHLFNGLNRITISNRRLDVMLSDEGLKAQLNALPEHNIKTVDLPLHLILTKKMWLFHPLLGSSWKKLFNKHITHHEINGLHGAMFHSPYLSELTQVIKKISQSKE